MSCQSFVGRIFPSWKPCPNQKVELDCLSDGEQRLLGMRAETKPPELAQYQVQLTVSATPARINSTEWPWRQKGKLQSICPKRDRLPAALPLGLEYTSPTCEETWDLWLQTQPKSEENYWESRDCPSQDPKHIHFHEFDCSRETGVHCHFFQLSKSWLLALPSDDLP